MRNNTFTVSYSIEIAYEIIGFDNYIISRGGDIYNIKTTRKIKKTLNGYTKGFWIGKKFMTEHKLKPLLKRPENYNCPF